MDEERYTGLIEVVVESVRVHMLSSQHVVILKARDRERYLLIWIGPAEANSIATKLQGLVPERPQTHDTFMLTIGTLGAQLEAVVIADLAEDTFHARLHLQSGDRHLEVDSRPSDALALAVRAGTPIYVAPDVLERAGVTSDAESGTGTGGPLESGGLSVPEEGLEVFRDFVNSLDVDPEGEHREGPGPDPG